MDRRRLIFSALLSIFDLLIFRFSSTGMRTRSRGYAAENEEEAPACDGNGDRAEQRPEKAREETEAAGTRKEPAAENEAEETLLQIEPRMMGMEVDEETEIIRPVIDTQVLYSYKLIYSGIRIFGKAINLYIDKFKILDGFYVRIILSQNY